MPVTCFLVVALIAVTWIWFQQHRRRRRKWVAAVNATFVDVDFLSLLNPLDRLRYDWNRNWIVLGSEIGRGYFGVIVEGRVVAGPGAEDGKSSRVAVKMALGERGLGLLN